MIQVKIGSCIIEAVQGDITNQPDIDAIVNAANAQLLPGGGVAGAIHRAAGPELARECQPMAPISVGQAVISDAHQLLNRRVIHCLGPVYGSDEPAEQLLADCYRNALKLAEQYQLTSIAFPAISAGAFGYPLEAAAEVAVKTVAEELPALSSVRLVRFVLFSKGDLAVFERVLEALA